MEIWIPVVLFLGFGFVVAISDCGDKIEVTCKCVCPMAGEQ